MTTADTPLPRKAAVLLLWIEKYVLPLVYAFLASKQFQFLWSQYSTLKATHAHWMSMDSLYVGDFIKHLLLFILMVFTGSTLLLNRSPVVLPDKLKHILVPLGMSFYFVLYSIVDDLPLPLRQNLLTSDWQLPLSVVAMALSIMGYSLSIWAIVHLGRAFALFVSVRKVVLGGPYTYVRHPIYAGYLLDSAGLLCVTCSVAMFVLVLGFIVLIICRGKLEEEMLKQSSDEYKRHHQQTGFLFPRLRCNKFVAE